VGLLARMPKHRLMTGKITHHNPTVNQPITAYFGHWLVHGVIGPTIRTSEQEGCRSPRMARPPARAQKIADELSRRITEGGMASGSWLPPERELAAEFDADRSTIKRALLMLEEQGLVTSLAGVGAKVANEFQRNALDITSRVGNWRGFHVSAERSGQEAFTDTEVRDVEADVTVAKWLAVPTGTQVLERSRLQGIVGEPPVQSSTTWIVPDVAERLPILRQVNTGPGGMLSRIEELGYQLRFEDVVTARMALKDERTRLQIDEREPVLEVWRRCYDQGDRVIEVTQRVVVGGRHELIYRYDAAR